VNGPVTGYPPLAFLAFLVLVGVGSVWLVVALMSPPPHRRPRPHPRTYPTRPAHTRRRR
jgi:hypothetical protein